MAAKEFEICALCATNLKASDTNGKSDPYMKLRLQSAKHSFWRTTWKKATLNPVWNEKTHVKLHKDDIIIASLFDKDIMTDDYLGYCEISVDEISSELHQLSENGTQELTKTYGIIKGEGDVSFRFKTKDNLDEWFLSNNSQRKQTSSPFLRYTPVVARSTTRHALKYVESLQSFQVEDEMIPNQELTVICKIGSGSFGTVNKAMWRGTEVAIKSVFGLRTSEKEAMLEEIAIMRKLRHPNIVLMLGYTISEDNDLGIVIEYMERGSLRDVLVAKPSFPWPTQLKMATQAARGLNYLHSNRPPIIHRDMKSLNLLISEDFTLKVSDFGLSKILDGENAANSKLGTLNWLPPEIIRGGPFTVQADIYSYGMVLYEILTHKFPYENVGQIEMIRRIDDNERPELPPGTFVQFAELVCDCWADSASARPPLQVILNRLKEILASLESKQIDITLPLSQINN